ncbi:Threonine synthase [Smittium mucronatum]|uniref:threonine synthase n=1 Tax=Smittium mucronatum TaxID=133383 RepID=A0A1R0GZ68_9FUNG|nr:Threonine synthase [Smittium mucronatum]
MLYRSTRGKASGFTFEEAVMTGLASDGGLFIPNEIPKLPADFLTTWKDYTFSELSLQVLSLFISESEIPRSDLKRIIDASYSTFTNKDITPLVQIDKEKDLWILELFHGPTFAFKDVALQFLGNLFEFFLKRKNSSRKSPTDPLHRLTIVGATSGDTGGAAIYGLKGKENVSVFIMHPNNRVSPIQKAQMTTVLDANIHNIAIEGTFDDCQDIVKALFGREDFRVKHSLGAINSINWARILAQTVYYFQAYFTLVRAGHVDPKIVFFTPTGNFGDILAGYYAAKLGLPVSRLVVSTNSNDIIYRFFKTGFYQKGAAGVLATPSPAMDILVSSNFERFCWYLAYQCEATGKTEQERIDQAGHIITKWMDDLKTTGKFQVSPASLEMARKELDSGTTSDEDTYQTINEYYSVSDSSTKVKYLLDPHTAVGVHLSDIMRSELASDLGYSNYTSVCLSTAHPSKFVEAVEHSLKPDFPEFDINPLLPEQFVGIFNKTQRCEYLPNDIDAVAKFIESKVDY